MIYSTQRSSFRILIFVDPHNLLEIAASHQENTKHDNYIPYCCSSAPRRPDARCVVICARSRAPTLFVGDTTEHSMGSIFMSRFDMLELYSRPVEVQGSTVPLPCVLDWGYTATTDGYRPH
jgi:hypothetical protein